MAVVPATVTPGHGCGPGNRQAMAVVPATATPSHDRRPGNRDATPWRWSGPVNAYGPVNLARLAYPVARDL